MSYRTEDNNVCETSQDSFFERIVAWMSVNMWFSIVIFYFIGTTLLWIGAIIERLTDGDLSNHFVVSGIAVGTIFVLSLIMVIAEDVSFKEKHYIRAALVCSWLHAIILILGSFVVEMIL